MGFFFIDVSTFVLNCAHLSEGGAAVAFRCDQSAASDEGKLQGSFAAMRMGRTGGQFVPCGQLAVLARPCLAAL